MVLLSGEPDTNLMKITIEPSKLGRVNAPPKVVIDTQHDDDLTGECVEHLLGALVAYGHNQLCIDEWVLDRAEMLEFALNTEDDGSFVGGSITRCGDVELEDELEDYTGADAFAAMVPTTGLDELTVNMNSHAHGRD